LYTEEGTIEYNFDYLRSSYYKTLKALNEPKVDITLSEFGKDGIFFIYFDLSMGSSEEVLRPVYKTNLRLSLKWKKQTEKPLTLMILSEGVSTLEINGKRETKLIQP